MTTRQQRIKISIDKNRTIENLIKLFFKKVGYPEYFGDNSIIFLYNADILFHNSQDLIMDIYKPANDTIVVDDRDDKLEFINDYIL